MTVYAYLLGEEIRWRDDAYARRWHVGFIVGRDGPYFVVRLRNGSEISMHPQNVKPKSDGVR